jgi:predicted AlkP superfamily phosphohydrolase/phosphomutase
MTTHRNSGDSQESHTKLCTVLATSTLLKTKLGRYLIGRKDLDLVFFVFAEAHKAGHWLWKYHDERHPDNEACAPALKEGLLHSYKQIDRAVAELLGLISADDNLIVFSDHGMQPAYRGDHLIDLVLERLGLLAHHPGSLPHIASEFRPLAAQAAAIDASPFRNGAKALLRQCKSALKRQLPRAVAAALSKGNNSFPGIDWSKTRAFSLPTDRNSHIRINLKGREPKGAVNPGGDYNALLDQLEAGFRSLINPLTGRAAVEEVFRIRSLFPGERSEDLPDVSILWSAEAPIDEVSSPELGTIRNPTRDVRSGNHRAEGFLLARGPHFKEGPGKYKGDILQIAPTLLHLHRVSLPEQYEMSPLEEILR